MWPGEYIQIGTLIFVGLAYLFIGFTERYCSSEIRKELSYKLSKYYFLMVIYFFILIIPFVLMILSYDLNYSIPKIIIDIIPMFLFYIPLGYLAVTYYFLSPSKLTEFKKVKLADEIYLDRVKKLRIKDFFLNRYRFTARLIKKYGKIKTIFFYEFIIFLFFTSYILVIYFCFSINLFCFYLFMYLLFFIALIYNYKKSSEKLEKSIQMASRWHSEDMGSNILRNIETVIDSRSN